METTTKTTPNLHEWDFVMINSSGGKDSQTALREVIRVADAQAYPRERIVVVHADLGKMEWDGVPELARRQAEHYGLEFKVVARRKADGSGDTILEYARRRKMWPSSTSRYCTSDFKRSPCLRVIVELHRRVIASGKASSRILNVFGFRAEESPARAKRQVFAANTRASSQSRTVYDWLPIHDWLETQVWEDIKASGVEHHFAYDLGMPRLSCCFCIFAPKPALMIAGKANPELLNQYVQLEAEIGHEFRKGQPISDIKKAIEANEQIGRMSGDWNM